MLKTPGQYTIEYNWIFQLLNKNWNQIDKLSNAAIKLKIPFLVEAIRLYQETCEKVSKILVGFGHDEEAFSKLFEDNVLKQKKMDLKTTLHHFITLKGNIIIRQFGENGANNYEAQFIQTSHDIGNSHKRSDPKETSIKILPAGGPISIEEGSVAYPICLSGAEISQTLHQVLKQRKGITVINPHGAVNGNDPYFGFEISSENDYVRKAIPKCGTFEHTFSCVEVPRFGDKFVHDNFYSPNDSFPQRMESSREAMRKFMTENYFRNPTLQPGKKHFFIAVNRAVHIIMYRLLEANVNLSNVIIVAINYPDQFLFYSSDIKSMKRYFEAVFGIDSASA